MPPMRAIVARARAAQQGALFCRFSVGRAESTRSWPRTELAVPSLEKRGASPQSVIREAPLCPQFLLRRWCNDAGKLLSFSIREGRVICSALAPRSTGYENALYAVIANALGIDEDHLERKFFAPIDSNAAAALGKIERREAITPDDKIAWAFFLNSLRIRQPDVLAHLRDEGMKMLKALLAEGDAALPPGSPSTEQWFD